MGTTKKKTERSEEVTIKKTITGIMNYIIIIWSICSTIVKISWSTRTTYREIYFYFRNRRICSTIPNKYLVAFRSFVFVFYFLSNLKYLTYNINLFCIFIRRCYFSSGISLSIWISK